MTISWNGVVGVDLRGRGSRELDCSVSWHCCNEGMTFSMSLLMPGQYTQSRALCFVLTSPWCELCSCVMQQGPGCDSHR